MFWPPPAKAGVGSSCAAPCALAAGSLARVGPELVDATDPLYTVSGTSSAVTFSSDVLPSLTDHRGQPWAETTAYGMFADLLRAAGAL